MNNDGTWKFYQNSTGDTALDTIDTYTYNDKKATVIASELYMETWISTAGQPMEVIREIILSYFQWDGNGQILDISCGTV
jgi:hypothetical protein